MDLLEAKKLTLEKMAEHNIGDWSFKYNNSFSCNGSCCHAKKTITLSRVWVLINDEPKVLNTILHEIAHALTRGHDHDQVWRKKAIEIGCDGERCAKTTENITKYEGIFTCGHSVKANKRDFNRYRCLRCARASVPNVSYEQLQWQETNEYQAIKEKLNQ